MQTLKHFLVFLFCTTVLVNLATAQVKDTLLKPIDTVQVQKTPLVIEKLGPKSKIDTVKSNYINPGKVAGRKAIIRSLIVPGWGQLYNIQLLKDGYGERAGKSHVLQKAYTIGKIGAIYGGFGALTFAYVDARKNYKIFLKELQYRFDNNAPFDPNGPFGERYSDAGITNGKNTYKRNSQIVIFSYGLLYLANVLDAYIAARLHFFNVDDNLAFNLSPCLQNTTLYGSNYVPSIKFALTF
ncbi:hypothetical protein ABIB40_000795 [Pedobacter sp. UYP30]|uniref:DUF5683 domain-containing protein n=1 Tax=Pedobacter sp. UYP30 TaxID=1756400 RepID=UPI0033910894